MITFVGIVIRKKLIPAKVEFFAVIKKRIKRPIKKVREKFKIGSIPIKLDCQKVSIHTPACKAKK